MVQVAEQMNSSSGRSEPARSFHQPHQQAFFQQQQQQQQQQQYQRQAMPPMPLRQSSREKRERSKSNHTDYSMGSMDGNMVLDPETGEMVPAAGDYEDEDDAIQVLNEKQPVVIKLGQLKTKHAHADN